MTRFSRDYAARLFSKQESAYARTPGPRDEAPIIPRPKRPALKGEPVFPLLCVAAGYPEPRQEYEFHPTRKWRFDYAWPEVMVAIEQDGGIWRKGGGAHSHPLNIERDIAKFNAAALLGWRILRYAPEDLAIAIIDLCGVFAKCP